MPGHIERVFLGWQAPVMKRAAAWLCTHADHGVWIDLSRTLVVVQGARAGRQLTAALVDEGTSLETPLLLPRVVTPDGLLREILGGSESCATEMERVWAWLRALQALPDRSRRMIAARAVTASDFLGGVRLARAIDLAHRTLGGDALRFRDVASRLEGKPESARWSALAELEVAFVKELERDHLIDPVVDRIVRFEQGRLRCPKSLVFLGVSELSKLARRVLAAATDFAKVTAVIVAPNQCATHFDEYGCVRPGGWTGVDLEREVGLTRDQFRVVQTPRDQADAALEHIESWPALGAEDIVIGNMDAEVASHLITHGAACGAEIRRGEGHELVRTSAFRLLTAIAEYAEASSFRGLGSLLRHADVSRWLASKTGVAEGCWLPTWDEYVVDSLAPSTQASDQAPESVRQLISVVHELLGPISPSVQVSSRPVSTWCADLLRVLDALRANDADVRVPEEQAGYSAMRGLVGTLAEVRGRSHEPQCTAHDALRLILDLAQGVRVPDAMKPQAIEMLGWLELVCDDSQAVVLTGFNEGNVPSRARETLLTEAVQRECELPTAEAQGARDLYLLAALAGSGRRLAIICGRVTNEGDPLLPSRLMFSCSREEVVRRVAMWRDENVRPPRRPGDVPLPASSSSEFRILVPDPTPPSPKVGAIERYSVTSFRDYLASPYLYYLRHVVRLSEIEEPLGELDAAGFGDLIHECLAAFGRSSFAHSTRERDIEEFLSGEIDRVITSRFGAHMPMGVRIQREHARGRLRAIAHWQASHVREGWAIRHVEWSPELGSRNADAKAEHGVAFNVDGTQVQLIGRIDRIDQHHDGRWLLLDYKTAANRSTPEQTHLKGKGQDARWVDLQLPLYRRLAESVCGQEPRMGYVCVPMKGHETGLAEANWTSAQLASAEEQARQVIRCVRRGEFFELGRDPAEQGVAGWLSGTGLIADQGDDDETEVTE